MKLYEYLSRFKGLRVAVVGAGVSNTPLIGELIAAGIDTTVCDKRSRREFGGVGERLESLGAKLRLGDCYLDDLEADIIFRTPGIMPSNPPLEAAVRRGAVLTSEMEVFFEICPCNIIGVTGSDGKTTTTSIIAELLKKEGRRTHIGGNIGTPLLCCADEMRLGDTAVLELSSFQLITMRKSPDIAVFINITPNHLDVHRDMEEYSAAKCNIFRHQKKSNRAVFNLDNSYTRSIAHDAPADDILFFSRRATLCDGVYCDGENIYDVTGGERESIMRADDIFLPGAHNIENFMAAFAAVRGLVSHAAMAETARTFRGVRHRLELAGEVNGVRYYNDSIATSPARTIAGLRAFDRKVILIAGGYDKGVPFDELGAEIPSHVKTLILTGLTAEKIQAEVKKAAGCTGGPEIIIREDFSEAVLAAHDSAQAGDIVLLSPACASFDRFKDFQERGNLFTEIVNKELSKNKLC